MASIRNLKEKNGAVFYPLTHEKAVKDSNGVSLETKLAALESKSYVVAWDGTSTPVVANIPAGVVVTYNSTNYTGTLAASASTIGKIYLVKNGTVYDRYITSQSGSSYSWVQLGSTEMDLSGYATDEELNLVEQEMLQLSTPNAIKTAIYTLLQNVAFINNYGYTAELDKLRVWAENVVLISISATFTQGTAEIYDTDSLNKLKRYLTVTATYDDSSTIVLSDSNYSLSGELTIGTSTITVTYQGKTDTFTVVVTASPYIYVLPSPFTSTGSNPINTGFKPEKEKSYTILLESQQTTASSSAVFIYGNRKTSSDNSYIGISMQNNVLWGNAITYSGRITVGSNIFRSAIVFDVPSTGIMSNLTHSYKNGSGNVASVTADAFGPDITDSAHTNIYLGAQYSGGGFLGVINTFIIYDGRMSSEDILDFLNNGM